MSQRFPEWTILQESMLGVVEHSMSGNLERVQALESRLYTVESMLVVSMSPQPLSAAVPETLGRQISGRMSDEQAVAGMTLMIPQRAQGASRCRLSS